MRSRKKLAVVGALATLGLIGSLFVFSPFAKADDIVDTHVGLRDVPVYRDGVPSAGTINTRMYATQFDADADGNTDADSQRAVCRAYKVNGAKRILIQTCRLQRHLGGGVWETLKSAGPKNTNTAASVAVFTAPPTTFACDRTRYRVQLRGLVRWNNNSLNAFNGESHHWTEDAPSPQCDPL